MRISEVARESGVATSTLRYYERIGLLQALRSSGGYRVYDEPTRDRLSFVLMARRLGLSLPKIGELLRVWDDEPCERVQDRLRGLVDEQLQETRLQIVELLALEARLLAGRARLDAIPGGEGRCVSSCPLRQAAA